MSEELLFTPLGGVGEIGMNLALYGYGGKWLMVDCGLTFADDALPGIDLLFPDPAFIAERKDDLVGLVLTHAHEDHLGAVQYLWPQLQCPVYATPYTAYLLKKKLSEVELVGQVPLTVVPTGGEVDVGGFWVSYIPVTHSIIEAHSLAITTPAGTVVHSGDWKLDPDPLVGPVTDDAALKAVGDAGVLALICDSTNVLNDGRSRSESEVRQSLIDLVAKQKGRVVVTTFASNVARISSIAKAAEASGRSVVLAGRSLRRNVEAARACGYLEDVPQFLDEDEASYIPRESLLILCTGCQGEERGALNRIAFHDHKHIGLEAGDTVIFSSKIIPGNERTIGRVQNRLIYEDIKVITEKDHFVHVSGHPARDEMSDYYSWVRPEISVPVHGEARHLSRHAEFARGLGIDQAPVIENGDVLRLSPGPVEVIDHVHSGRLAWDGGRLTALDSRAVQRRRRMMFNGIAFVMLVLDEDNELAADPRVVVRGVFDQTDEDDIEAFNEVLVLAAERAFEGLIVRDREDDVAIFDNVSRSVRSVLRRASDGRRPAVEVEIVRLEELMGEDEE